MNVTNNDYKATLLYSIIYVITKVKVFIKNIFIQNSQFLYGHTHIHIHINNDIGKVPTRITKYTRELKFVYTNINNSKRLIQLQNKGVRNYFITIITRVTET